MARVAAVLRMTATALWRERRSLLSVTTNNFFATIAFFFFFGIFVDYTVGVIFYLLVAVLLLFPLSADPVQKIPPERLALWPMSGAEHWLLRVLAPWLNPITLLFCGLVLWSAFDRDAKTFGVSAVVMAAILLLVPLVPQGGGRSYLWRAVPRFPSVLGQLIRKDLRQLLSMLDFWLAALLSGAFLQYRLLAHYVQKLKRSYLFWSCSRCLLRAKRCLPLMGFRVWYATNCCPYGDGKSWSQRWRPGLR